MSDHLRIIIIDDDPIVLASLQSIVEMTTRQDSQGPIEVVGLGQSGREAVRLYQCHKPDLVLLDIRMDDLDGLEACKEIRQADPEAKILFLTTFPDEEYIVEALRLGAKGYLMKSAVESLVPALRAIAQGQRVFGEEIVDILALGEGKATGLSAQDRAAAKAKSVFAILNDREWDLVQLVAEAKTNKEIAEILHFSEGTVRNYLSEILEKLGLRDRTQLAVTYYKEGFAYDHSN